MSIKRFFRKLNQYMLPDEEIVEALSKYLSFDDSEVQSILQQARGGSKVAQYIVGMALMNAKHFAAADGWLELSADQGFQPAKVQRSSSRTGVAFRA